MKMLVVGMDGASAKLINGLQMPFLQSLLTQYQGPDLKEDLWSRGWAEIVSGAHARDTGAFYNRPAEKGSHNFTQSYRLADFDKAEAARPIWDVLNAKGVRSGLMNIPTTFPAPAVDGFFISGAGSGVGGSGAAAVPDGAVTPKELSAVLEQEGYVFDLRLWASNIGELSGFIEKQVEMTERRTDCFLKACGGEPPEFGFIAYMMTRSLFNLCMAEIQAYIANDRKPANAAQQQLVDAFAALDRCVERLFEELKPERYMLVSDHGTEPYLNRIDLNVFLRGAGFQPSAGRQLSLANKLRKAARRTLPKSLRQKLNKGVPSSFKSKMASHGVDLSRAQAFAARYVSGVYVNDARFGGPISEGDVAGIVDKVCAAFNADPEAAANGLKASPYKSEFADAQFAWMLPDVWIDHPDTVFFEHGIGEGAPSGGRFIYPNTAYGPLPPLSEVTRDLWTGIKGSVPLFAVDAQTAALIRPEDPMDLRLAHHLIERNFA